MKRYSLSFAASLSHTPEHPDRTAKRAGVGIGSDVTFQVWTNRTALARSIRMQQRRAAHYTDWRPVVALGEVEGY